MSETFKWPVPSYYELIHSGITDQDGNVTPAAVITMADGRWQAGLLLDLDGANGMVSFMPKRGKDAVALRLDAIKSIRLTEPIALTRLQLSQQTVDGNPEASTQKCTVHFKEGEPLQADTAGYIFEPYGLFLYLMTQADNVLRWFIPAEAMMSYQIGEHLGKMLLDEHLVSLDAITTGLEIQESLRANKLGDYLKRQNIVTQAQLEDVLQRQKKHASDAPRRSTDAGAADYRRAAAECPRVAGEGPQNAAW